MLDPRTPVLIGAGQLNQRVDQGAPPLEPVDLLAEAARLAAADAGAPGLLAGVDTIAAVQIISWRYRDPAALVAGRIGAVPKRTWYTGPGGNNPQTLVNRLSLDILRGDADLCLIGGAEAWRTRTGLRRHDERPDWTVQDDQVAPTEVVGEDPELIHPGEAARGIVLPVQIYPLFENALRARLGLTRAQHLERLGRLWAGFSEVAAANPHAWIRTAYTPEQLTTPGPDNRMVGYPYTKLLNSNASVEQGAALLLCSAARADELGVPRDRWVFPLSGSDAGDTRFVSNRTDLSRSPAIRLAGRAALALAGVDADDVAHADVYSCFPSAVQVAAEELGLGLDRPLTVTGGLSFAGGPWNNYVTHGIAAMAGVLREDAGAVGLCTANGGFLTKHAFGLYSTEPPAAGFRHADPQGAVDDAGSVELCEEWDGPATVESFTVMHDRDGNPENAIVAARLADGRRAWGTSRDPEVVGALLAEDRMGDPARLSPDGTVALA